MSGSTDAFRLIRLAEVDSTNVYAASHWEDLADRDVVLAETQTNGRGRLDRRWVSHLPGNLYMTLVLKPVSAPGKAVPWANLTQYCSVVLCRVLEEYGVEAGIKWPNDIQVAGQKVAGILAESRSAGGRMLGVLVGVGVNLNMPAAVLAQVGQPATSLNLLVGRAIDRELFSHSLIGTFFAEYPRFLESGFSALREEYLKRCKGLGRTTTVRLVEGTISGTAVDVDTEGRLVLIDAAGQRLRCSMGEICSGWPG